MQIYVLLQIDAVAVAAAAVVIVFCLCRSRRHASFNAISAGGSQRYSPRTCMTILLNVFLIFSFVFFFFFKVSNLPYGTTCHTNTLQLEFVLLFIRLLIL